MPTAVKIWEVAGSKLRLIEDDSFSSNHVEKDLESWIEKERGILGDPILIFARQPVGKPDLLGIDRDGSIVIVELKRDRTAREALAQSLDYASWLDAADESQIEVWASEYFSKQPSESSDQLKDAGNGLKDRYSAYFDVEEVPEISNQRHRILLVAPRLDASAERIIAYLAERHHMQINAVFFQYARLSSGQEVLARAMLVPADSVGQAKLSKSGPTADELAKIAAEREAADLLKECRSVSQWWSEEPTTSFGGAFRYWGKSTAGKERMIFGVNVTGKANPPKGAIDVWVPTAKMSEVTGLPEEDIRNRLQKHRTVDIQLGKNKPTWIRLMNQAEARALVDEFRQFAQPSNGG